MAGHSKWANIQHRKNRQDERKGKTFGRLIKEITVAAKLGGEDVTSNPRLRLAIDRAKEANMPKDKVNDAIKRGTGQLEGVNYEEIRYEGYGPSGVAIIVDCLTDNRTRTVSEVRHAFTKNGGNLGTDGSVSYLFQKFSQFLVDSTEDEERVMEVVLEAGAIDITNLEKDVIEIIGPSNKFLEIEKALNVADIRPLFSEVILKAETQIVVNEENIKTVHKLIDVLEAIEDVQNVYSNVSN